jgi:cysteinyl-tRNA synthetase
MQSKPSPLATYLYNTLTRRVERLKPSAPPLVKIYHCGPTVYASPHIGNLRRFITADLLRRVLEFLGWRVKDVMNITDVGHLTQDDIDQGEDKIIAAARRAKVTPQMIAEKYTREFFAAIEALRIKRASAYPRATEFIPQMQKLIARLLKRGHAYQTSSGVYYDVTTFPSYGKLSGNTLAQIQAGARIPPDEKKRHPADFALWKRANPAHLMRWPSPWGEGYPGWHIECSAMALTLLQNPDIHTGGQDNIFPHHENEIAQAEGATGKTFVRYWVHNGLLTRGGEKIAKRTGKFYTLADIRAHGFDPLDFRMLVLTTHYRSTLEFSWTALAAARKQRQFFTLLQERLQRAIAARITPDAPAQTLSKEINRTRRALRAYLAQDLRTPQALARITETAHQINAALDEEKFNRKVIQIARSLLADFDTVFAVLPAAPPKIPPAVKKMVAAREKARQQKDFAKADLLRKKIFAAGFVIEDTPQGPRLRPK